MLFGLMVSGAQAADLPSRTPGLWQSTSSVTGPDGQPLANAVNVVTVSCVDELSDKKFLTTGASRCSRLNISGGPGSYNIDGTCAQQGVPVQIHETLTYEGKQNVKLTAQLSGSASPMTVNSQLQWQGACLPGMSPGDEGTVTGGTFIKTDNINDYYNQ